MERDDRDMERNDNATPTTEAPADGPSREPGEPTPTTDSQEIDGGATSQDQPGGES